MGPHSSAAWPGRSGEFAQIRWFSSQFCPDLSVFADGKWPVIRVTQWSPAPGADIAKCPPQSESSGVATVRVNRTERTNLGSNPSSIYKILTGGEVTLCEKNCLTVRKFCGEKKIKSFAKLESGKVDLFGKIVWDSDASPFWFLNSFRKSGNINHEMSKMRTMHIL